jgi:hypothetical protein
LSLFRQHLVHLNELSMEWNFHLLNALSAAARFACAVYLLHHKRFSWALLLALPLAGALVSGSFQSLLRILCTLFPMAAGCALLGPGWRRTIALSSAVLLGIMTLLFALRVSFALA